MLNPLNKCSWKLINIVFLLVEHDKFVSGFWFKYNEAEVNLINKSESDAFFSTVWQDDKSFTVKKKYL